MESNNGGFASADIPSIEPPWMSLPTGNTSNHADDYDEWEYEYSATEVETYYLTLDLTTPSVPVTRPSILRSGRGGHKAAWTNPGLGIQKRQLELAPTISLTKGDSRASVSVRTSFTIPKGRDVAKDGDADVQDGEADAHDREADAHDGTKDGESDSHNREADNQHGDADAHDGGADTQVREAGGDDDVKQDDSRQFQSETQTTLGAEPLQEPQIAKKPDEVQILELHSENPIIVYKGHTFSCRWAENIGTELLFTTHDSAKPLPVLRSLADNVDLLAASSARIISTSASLVTKSRRDIIMGLRDRVSNSYGQPEVKQIIPIGINASESRKEQARFLEQIMKIKAKRGEADAVTVNARTRLHPSGWRVLVKQKRESKKARLRSLIKNGGTDAADAAKELEEMRRDDVKFAEEERIRKAANSQHKTVGRKRKRKTINEAGHDARGRRVFRRPRRHNDKVQLSEEYSGAGTPTPVEEHPTRSMPTPRSWSDLEDNDTDDEFEEEDIMDDG